MSVFGGYARYYDLLYRDKDYAGETQYILSLMNRYAPSARTILDLGCGTGAHAAFLAQSGLQVTGVDRSEEMLHRARSRRKVLTSAVAERLTFQQGDIRTLSLSQKYDAVISLFHVVSYLTRNADLDAAFAAVSEHLKPGGLFVFDCWYGPAVLSDPPKPRLKRLEDEAVRVIRIAEPVTDFNENTVEVNYHLLIEERETGAYQVLGEIHKMRYLFKQELQHMLNPLGLSLVMCEEWMTGRAPGVSTWSVVFAVRREA
jgi:SAM-dependent methyltransferase